VSVMRFNWLAKAGLFVTMIGWLAYLFGVLAPVISEAEPRIQALVPIDIAPYVGLASDIGRNLILTGLGLAVLGVLRSGFGAFNRFFDAILKSASAPRPEPKPPLIDPNHIVERGRIRDRGYVMYGDGSVEVETLVGIRRFPSREDAQSFVGA
jgi:hypothetical protein